MTREIDYERLAQAAWRSYYRETDPSVGPPPFYRQGWLAVARAVVEALRRQSSTTDGHDDER